MWKVESLPWAASCLHPPYQPAAANSIKKWCFNNSAGCRAQALTSHRIPNTFPNWILKGTKKKLSGEKRKSFPFNDAIENSVERRVVRHWCDDGDSIEQPRDFDVFPFLIKMSREATKNFFLPFCSPEKKNFYHGNFSPSFLCYAQHSLCRYCRFYCHLIHLQRSGSRENSQRAFCSLCKFRAALCEKCEKFIKI